MRRAAVSRLPLLLLALGLALVFYRLFMGEVFFWGLPSLQFYPWREYAFDLLRAGQLPLWNPLNGAGAPLFANYQSSLLYPLSWLGFFLPLANTMSIVAVLHPFIAGWGMWRFTGALGFSALGRGVSALAFAMTSYLMARLGTYPIIQAAAWLPWMLWAASRLLDNGRPRAAGFLAIFTALLLLAGHAQTAWYSLLLVGLFALWRALFLPLHWRWRVGRLALVVGCFALGAGIAALQLVATAELLRQSQRSAGVDFDFAMNYSYNPVRVLNLLSPNVFGTPADGSYITGGAFFEDAVYVGLLPLVAALGAVVRWIIRRGRTGDPVVNRSTPFWMIIVAIGFIMALGINTAVFPFLYNNVPTFNLFQAPVRWHLWTVVGLSVLAGMGVSAWSRSARVRRWAIRAAIACGAVAVLALLAATFFASSIPAVRLLTQALVGVGLLGVLISILALAQPEKGTNAYGRWSFLVLLLVAADLVWAAWGLNPTVPASWYGANRTEESQSRAYWTPETEEQVKFEQYFRFNNYPLALERQADIRASKLSNLNMIDRVPLLNNFEPLLVGHYADYLDLIEQPALNTAADRFAKGALLRGAGVGTFYTCVNDAPCLAPMTNAVPLIDPGCYTPDTLCGLTTEYASGARAWLVTSGCWHPDEAALKTALSDPAWQPDRQAHMLGDGGCDAPETSGGSVSSLIDNANVVTINVDAERGGWLVLADTDYPGWYASVDGTEAPIFRANLAFRAVQVDAGAHEIRFEYRPGWLLPGALVSLLSLVVALLLYRLGA